MRDGTKFDGQERDTMRAVLAGLALHAIMTGEGEEERKSKHATIESQINAAVTHADLLLAELERPTENIFEVRP